MTSRRDIGTRIRRRRRYLDLSQQELAARLGVHQNSVSNWETGRQSLTIERLIEVADVLEISVADLVGDRAPAA